jgi:Flp pilus assembly protein TadG
MNKPKSQRGSILVELVFVCVFLMMFMLGTIEVINIIRADIYIQKIAREGAREAAISGDTEAGRRMAEDAAQQYFGSSQPTVLLYTNQSTGDIANVVCDVSYDYKFFFFLNNNGLGGRSLDAKAIYPWWDETS